MRKGWVRRAQNAAGDRSCRRSGPPVQRAPRGRANDRSTTTGTRSGTAASPSRPRRRPHPRRQRHRPGQPTAVRVRPEPDLVCDRAIGLRANRLAADAGPTQSPGPPLGTQTPTAAVCFRSLADSPATPAEPDSASPPTPRGPICWSPRWPACNPTDQHQVLAPGCESLARQPQGWDNPPCRCSRGPGNNLSVDQRCRWT